MSINNKAKELIVKILKETNDSEKLGGFVNDLSDIFWKGADCTLIYNFYNQCTQIVHYRSLSFVIDEGPFEKCPKALPVIKKLLCNKDPRVVYYVMHQYALLLKTQDELETLFSFLDSSEHSHRMRAITSLIAIVDNKQIKLLPTFYMKNKFNLVQLINDKNSIHTVTYIKEEITKSNEVNKKILFIYAAIKKFSQKDLKEIAQLSESVDIFDYYHTYLE